MGADETFLSMFEIIVDEDILMTASRNSAEVYVSDLLKLDDEYKVNEVMKSDSDPEFFNKLKKENKDFDYIITFMKYKSEADDCVIHFGNTEGCDCMKGKNIIVAGTPHYNEVVYKLIACHIGVDCDCQMRFREVTDSCYKYWLNTYENPQLRDIQLWILKSELIQAIGRARLLRYDCTVKLYAGIPLEQAVGCDDSIN